MKKVLELFSENGGKLSFVRIILFVFVILFAYDWLFGAVSWEKISFICALLGVKYLQKPYESDLNEEPTTLAARLRSKVRNDE